MNQNALKIFSETVADIKSQGTYKNERVLATPQGGNIDTTLASGVINMCANNYLGLCNDPEVITAARDSYDKWGYGLSSVRFICGTQQIHKELEAGKGYSAQHMGGRPARGVFACIDGRYEDAGGL